VTSATGRARRPTSRVLVIALAVALGAAAPGRAEASTETIKRSASNLLLFPLDFVLSPYVATKASYSAWRASDDTPGVKYGYAPFAIPWAVSLNLGASLLRGVAGALELLPGLILIPFDADMEPLYDLSEQNAALVDTGEESALRLRFGIDYFSPSEL
jgi:hypothetical protein